MSPEPIRTTRSPSGVRLVSGTPVDAFEEVSQRRIDAALVRGEGIGRSEVLRTGLQGLDDAVQRLDEATDDARRRVGEGALELALAIARRLLRTEIDAGRYDLETIVREVLHESGAGRGNCTVHVHPDDLVLLAGVEFRAGTELVPDTSVAKGDVRVTTPDGILVRDVERAVEAIGDRIRGDVA